MNQAYRTTAAGVTSIVAATSRGQAVGITLRSAREVGYRVAFTEVYAARAPEYDDWAAVQRKRQCFGEEFVKGATKEVAPAR